MAAEDWMDTDTWDGFVDDGITEERDLINKRHSVYGVPGRKEPKNWNGRSVHTMDSEHILNSILFCERKYVIARNNFIEAHHLHRELPEDIDNHFFYFKSVEEMFPDYKNLREEWEQRKRD